jgi:effector-binding domain-containing protein
MGRNGPFRESCRHRLAVAKKRTYVFPQRKGLIRGRAAMTLRWKRVSAIAVALCMATPFGWAQTTSSPAPSAPASPPAAAAPARPTLVPDAADTDVAEVSLSAKPAVIISGTSTGEEGFTTIRNAFKKLEEELGKAGIAPAGRPLAIFQQFNPDGSFNYDALIPIERAPEGKTLLTNEIRFGATPSGSALRFTHKNAYDEVESTYDMIEIYLEAKGITVKDPIIEEFVNDPKDASDPDLELNIFVQPK